ncbi:DNA primase family protein [Halodesulfovibrio aestuarii]|uniref:Phage/plasmid primase, P4 family n=1 Tax=Halodesulfovibrio aestuarii TaxID=126333 RepID=A0ABV4JX35_9BACT
MSDNNKNHDAIENTDNATTCSSDVTNICAGGNDEAAPQIDTESSADCSGSTTDSNQVATRAGTVTSEDSAAIQDAAEAEALEAMRQQVAARVDEEKAAAPEEEEVENALPNDFVLRCARSGDLGDGMLFSEIHRDRYVFNHQANSWMEWVGHHWRLDYTEQAKVVVEDVADAYMAARDELRREKKKAEEDGDDNKAKYLEKSMAVLKNKTAKLHDEKGRTACLKFARANRNPVAIQGDQIDRKPMLLPCENGVLDLRSGEFMRGAPGDYLVKSSSIKWTGIDTPCPAWEQALLEMMDDDQDMVEFLQRLLGYSATGSVEEQKFAVFSGKGRNGKGVIVEILTAVMGELAGAIQSEMLLDQAGTRNSNAPSPDIMDLRGLRMGFASETDEGRKFSAARVKWFTGDDHLVGRYPHDKRNVRFPPNHQLFLLTNNKPHAPAEDFAFWQRMLLIDFTQRFVEKPSAPNERKRDNRLKEKLKGELSGILAWIVRGALLWQKEGLNPPARVLETTSEYRKAEDLMEEFLSDCTIRDGVNGDAYILSRDIHALFEWWWGENVSRKAAPKQKKFGAMMREKGFPSEKISREGNRKGYKGIQLNAAMVAESKNGKLM